MIPVTRPWLPSRSRLNNYFDKIYSSQILTNHGPLVQELEERLTSYLGVKHVIAVANGTLALQILFAALELKGEVITTPFSFIASASSLQWQQLRPIFSDINFRTFNMEAELIQRNISPNTTAILPVHVFGNPCDVLLLEELAKENNIKLIFDASHAFGVKINGTSVLNYGDASTLSFHATKLFHTVEGGAIVTNDNELAQKIRLMINFGISSCGQIDSLGVNAKLGEFSAAMGLAVLEDIDVILEKRNTIYNQYKTKLMGIVGFQLLNSDIIYNSSYLPIVLNDESDVLLIIDALNKENIFPRRYFYPSLDSVSYLKTNTICMESRKLASRILCLPIFPSLHKREVDRICRIIIGILS